MVNAKNAFWQALVFTVIIFLFGFAFGFFIEGGRTEKLEIDIMNSEINTLDEQLRNKIGENFDINCDESIESTFNFADRIYSEAQKLEKYDSSNKFKSTLKILHKKYDLLRLMLWTESIKLKEKCDNRFHTVIYFFEYNAESIDIKSKQSFYGRILIDLKEKYPEKVLLIPIASNLELESINLSLKSFNIKESPAILIDEKHLITDISTFEEIEKLILENSSSEKIKLN